MSWETSSLWDHLCWLLWVGHAETLTLCCPWSHWEHQWQWGRVLVQGDVWLLTVAKVQWENPSSGLASSSSNCFAMVYAMVVLPEPAWPVSQKTCGLASEWLLAHLVISSNILTHVLSVHASCFRPCSSRTVLWSAFSEGCRRSRATFCSIYQCQSQAQETEIHALVLSCMLFTISWMLFTISNWEWAMSKYTYA